MDDQTTGRTGTTGTTGTGTTTGRTGVTSETERGTGMDVDVDTGDRARGAVDVDVNRTTDADTDASGVDETGGMDRDNAGAAGDYGRTDDLPNTASGFPLLGLIGLLALGLAASIRIFS
jgi:hypothetical protein